MKLIHCADLHLDSGIKDLPSEKGKILREDVLHSFERLVDFAAENGVKAVIIAGDFFDSEKITKKTFGRVLFAMSSHPETDFLYLAGNHDEDAFVKNFYDENLPSNLIVFGEGLSLKEYGEVNVYGVCNNSVNGNYVIQTLSPEKDKINVVVMHGQVADYNTDFVKDVISLPKLKEKNIDYLALGHYHTYSEGKLDSRGKYAYSGCLQGRGFDELGTKGFVLLDAENGKITTEFIDFSVRNFYEYSFDVGKYADWFTAKTKLIDELKKNYDAKSAIKIILCGKHKTEFAIDKNELETRLNELFFFCKVYDKTSLLISPEDYAYDKSVRGEFVRSVMESDLDDEEKYKVIMCGLNALRGEELL